MTYFPYFEYYFSRHRQSFEFKRKDYVFSVDIETNGFGTTSGSTHCF